MRKLRLQSPRMSGADVTAWQEFLASRDVFHGTADGIFGPITDQATRDYQTGAGLNPDGVVGPRTLAQAVADGFIDGDSVAGMDAEANCSAFADRLAAEGMKFVVRYYSNFLHKVLTREEARKLSEAGLQIAVVFEDSANIEAFTAESGANDAAKALELASEIGQPAGSAIYFAVDFNPSQADVQGQVTEYFQAVNRALAAAPVQYVAGVYGSGLTCRLIRDAGLANFTWLSNSSSYCESQAFQPQANLVQLAPSRDLFDGQLSIDDNLAQTAEFGGFRLEVGAPTRTS